MGCRSKGNKGKKPTRKQKIIMDNNGLNAQNWLVLLDRETVMYIVSKKTDRTRCINKGE